MRAVLAAGAVGMVVLASCSSGQEASGTLVVTGADGSVALLSTGGAVVETLDEGTTGPVTVAVQPTPSPTGEAVVWTSARPDQGVMVWDGEEVRAIEAPFLPFYYAWSPDAARLVMLGNSPRETVAGAILDPATGELWDLGDAQPFYLAWSPDGGRIAAHLDSDRLDLLSAEGERTPTLLGSGPYQAPAWLEDGRVVAVVSGQGLQAAALQVPGAEDQPRLVAAPPGRGTHTTLAAVDGVAVFAPSPDHTAVALLDGGLAGGLVLGRLKVVPLATRSPRPVSDDLVVMFEWAPSGGRLLVTSLDVAAGTLQPSVWDGSDLRRYPGYRPTGVLLGQYLPFWGQYLRSFTTWAPDGAAFTYAHAAEDGPLVMLQRLDADRPVEIGPGELATFLP